MTTYGLTSTGFVQKTQTDIIDEIETEQKDAISPALDVSADGPLGIFNGIIGSKLAELWEVALALYQATDPDGATGDAQDNISALTGTTRIDADYSTVTVLCTGDNLTVLSLGRVMTTGAGDRFESTAAATLALATAWAPGTGYTAGDIRSNNSNIYICATSGTSAGAGGPTTTADGIVDNTCTWDFVGDGLAYAAVAFQAEQTGSVSISADAIDTEDGVGAIETPVTGWEDGRNTSDGDIGLAIETDAALRIRREQELRATGDATLEAIIADVLTVDDVDAVFGFENVTDLTDGAGLPPHSIEIVVLGGTDADVSEQIWESKGGGIATYGSSSASVTDSQGDSHTIYFSRPSEITIHTKLTYSTDSDYPGDGDTIVKAAVAAWGNALGIGEDVVTSQIYEVIFEATTGIVDVTEILIGLVDPPVAVTNISITNRQISSWDTADIDLVVT